MVSPGASTGVFLDTGAGGDYLYLSLVKGLSDLWKEGWILVPHCIEFDFSYKGNFRLRYGTKGKLVKLIIPQGLNTWELKLTLPNKDCLIEKIIVCGDGPEPEMVN